MVRNLIVLISVVLCTASLSFGAEVAKVNEKAITDQDLKAALSGYNDVQSSSLLKDPKTRKQLVNNLIDQELLFQKAEAEKLDQGADFKEALANFKRQFMANKILEKNLTAKLTDKGAKAYYEKNKNKFSTDQVHAQHILVNSESEANDLLKKAKEKDADFQMLAEKNSKDPSAKNNRGDLGYFTRDRMVPEFSDAAFAAKENQVVGPVKTSFGYHIIKVVDFRPGKVPNYEEIELQVKNAYRQSLIEEYVTGLRKTAKISYKE